MNSIKMGKYKESDLLHIHKSVYHPNHNQNIN